jgi:hypothetical protein
VYALTTAKHIAACLYRIGIFISACGCCLTKKAEPPPTRDVNRDSGTASANGGWLRRLVRRHHGSIIITTLIRNPCCG